MRDLLTPRDLADAIGVSESSLRRWIDGGRIKTARTVGGHRRVALPEAVRFIRDSGAIVVRPELLGLKDLSDYVPGKSDDEADHDHLHQALAQGDESRARNLVLSMYLAGRSVAWICDGPIRQAMHRIGELWLHSPAGIMVEHRATDICLRTLHALYLTLTPPPADAPVAIGGAPQGDPYLLPSLMAGIVLFDAGFRALNFGPDTPLQLLGESAQMHNARLVWLAFSSPIDKALLGDQLAALARSLAAQKADLVVGGRQVEGSFLRDLPNAHAAGSMVELAAFARGILAQR